MRSCDDQRSRGVHSGGHSEGYNQSACKPRAFNRQKGGWGVKYIIPKHRVYTPRTAEAKARIAEVTGARYRGKKLPAEMRAKMSEAAKNRTPKHRANNLAALAALNSRPEHRAKLSAGQKRRQERARQDKRQLSLLS